VQNVKASLLKELSLFFKVNKLYAKDEIKFKNMNNLATRIFDVT